MLLQSGQPITLFGVLHSLAGPRCVNSCRHLAGVNSGLHKMAHGHIRDNHAAILSRSTRIIASRILITLAALTANFLAVGLIPAPRESAV